MTRRYYVPDLLESSGTLSLPDEEALHAVRVMRARVGDTIELFDGRGYQTAAEITAVDKRNCFCRFDPPVLVDRESAVRLTLATALPKPDRAKEMIERLTEIGVTTLIPIVFERTQRSPPQSLSDKLSRIVIEACKQSGRNQLMTIAPTVPFKNWIEACQNSDFTNRYASALVAMPSGQTNRPIVDAAGEREHLCVIGPEGGLTDSELQTCLERSMTPIDLGRRILRIETAACVIASRILVG